MPGALSKKKLEAAHCWLQHDEVPGLPELTEFRRAVRYHAAMWREANGFPIGTHRVRPGTPERLIGSQLDHEFARETGATFLSAKALAAARGRTAFSEPHQIFDHKSFWADLLSSPALAVNLFGDLAADLDRADRAVHNWWPDTPGRVTEVRFAHSPGRLDPSYSNSLRWFDAFFVLTFAWLEHILLLSMLQHESGRWTWGRYVVVHPEGNTDVAHAVDDYRERLADDATFASATVEKLLAAKVLAPKTTAALRRRYLP